MARAVKISEKQFVLDMINKEFEIIGSNLHWDTFEELLAWSKIPENVDWYNQYEFTSEEQYEQWKAYYMEHFYNWQAKYHSKKYVEKHCFPWFSLEYGFVVRWEK